MKKVTMDKLQEAIFRYARKPNTQRLGQFLMNELVPGEVSSVVFHEENDIKAVGEFTKRFVDF